jgi:hypothetical protein
MDNPTPTYEELQKQLEQLSEAAQLFSQALRDIAELVHLPIGRPYTECINQVKVVMDELNRYRNMPSYIVNGQGVAWISGIRIAFPDDNEGAADYKVNRIFNAMKQGQ